MRSAASPSAAQEHRVIRHRQNRFLDLGSPTKTKSTLPTPPCTIRGFCDFAQLAIKAGKGSDATTYRGLASKARDGFLQSFVDREGAIAGSVEELAQNQYLDGAVVEAFWNVLKDSRIRGSHRQSHARCPGPAARRIRRLYAQRRRQSSYDNNEWIMIDLRMADALWRAGRERNPRAFTQMIIDKPARTTTCCPSFTTRCALDGPSAEVTSAAFPWSATVVGPILRRC